MSPTGFDKRRCGLGLGRVSRGAALFGKLSTMSGAVVIAFVLVIAIPVGVLISMMVLAMILGTALNKDSDDNNAGSELVETNH